MLARLYHAHHNRHLEDLPFWLDLARRQGGPILELGCGTGRLLLPLAGAGFLAFGLERDAEMLAVLRENTPKELARGLLGVPGDMTAFELGLRFPLILLPCNTYSTLTPAQRLATLGCVRRHLAPHGLFAVSLPNPALLRQLPRRSEPEVEESFPHPLDGEPVQVSSGWRRTSSHLEVEWHYDHLLPDGRVERHTLLARHELASLQTYQDEIEAAGLCILEMYGDFDRTPYTQEAPSLIVLIKI